MARSAILIALVAVALAWRSGAADAEAAGAGSSCSRRRPAFATPRSRTGSPRSAGSGARTDFRVDATEDHSVFEEATLVRLRRRRLSLDDRRRPRPAQQAAFERYVRGNRGFVGVHSATDTEYDWAWYGELVGAYFASHPAIQRASVRDRGSASTPPRARSRSRGTAPTSGTTSRRIRARKSHVLATLDESTYSGGTMGADHPISWCRFFDGGRSWYTAMGHTSESYSDPRFLQHLLGGIQFAAGYPDCRRGRAPCRRAALSAARGPDNLPARWIWTSRRSRPSSSRRCGSLPRSACGLRRRRSIKAAGSRESCSPRPGSWGWRAFACPRSFGGSEMDTVSYAVAIEEISRVCANLGRHPVRQQLARLRSDRAVRQRRPEAPVPDAARARREARLFRARRSPTRAPTPPTSRRGRSGRGTTTASRGRRSSSRAERRRTSACSSP